MSEKPVFDLGPVVGGRETDIGVAVGDAGRSRQSQPVRQRDHAPRSRSTVKNVLVGVLVAAAAALFAVTVVRSGDDAASDEAGAVEDAAELAADELDTGANPSDPAPGVPRLNDDPPVISFQPPSAEHLRADDVALLFSGQIDTPARDYGIAYVAQDDFVVLDHRGITLPQVDVAVSFDTISNLALLTSGGRTWAIDPSDRDESFLVSNSYVVVVSPRPGTVAVISPDDRSEIELVSWALPVPSVSLPEGADLLWVQGRGPLVMPRTGGTFEVSGLASSLERISDDRAVAASADGTVYERCDDELRCAFVSQIAQGALVELPFQGTVAFDISPDGRWVLAVTETGTSMFDVVSGGEIAAFEPGHTAIAWSPDSDFVAIVADDILSIFYPDAQELVSLRLNHVPDNGSLLVFASDR